MERTNHCTKETEMTSSMYNLTSSVAVSPVCYAHLNSAYFGNMRRVVSTLDCTRHSQLALLREHGMLFAALNIIRDTSTCFLLSTEVARSSQRSLEIAHRSRHISARLSGHYLIKASVSNVFIIHRMTQSHVT